jgi:hypothetical protein
MSPNSGRQQRFYNLSPRLYTSIENNGGIISTGETPDSSTRALWKSYQQSNLVANQEELGEGNEFRLRNICVHTSK